LKKGAMPPFLFACVLRGFAPSPFFYVRRSDWEGRKGKEKRKKKREERGEIRGKR